MNKPLSIVIPTSGLRKHLVTLLTSIQKYTFDYKLEVIVVCNPENQQLQDLKTIFKNLNLKLMQLKIRGINNARQVGLELAQNELVLYLDDDCFFSEENQIDLLYEQMNSEEELFAVGGYYRTMQQDLKPAAQAYAQNQLNWLMLGVVDSKYKFNAYLIGGYFVVRKKMCEINDLKFDTSMIFGGTEKDFFLRAHSKNLKMKLLDIAIDHNYDNATLYYFQKVYKQGRGERHIFDKGFVFVPKYLTFFEQTIWLTLFDLVFWAGFYLSKNEYHKYIAYLVARARNNLNERKMTYLNRLKKRL